jgi:hypothetical protein
VKKIIFCFDGECGTSAVGEQAVRRLRSGEAGGDSITNVGKLHLLFGGTLLEGQTGRFSDQQSYYYAGKESQAGGSSCPYKPSLAARSLPLEQIIGQALRDLESSYMPGDEVCLFGFSRGSAIARRFALLLSEQFAVGDAPRIRFMGLFDTIAAFGAANLQDLDRPLSDVVFSNHTLAPLVDEALHLVALDEQRKAYAPTLLNRDERVTEIWFSGTHADIGGGRQVDGLSDITLQFMLNEIIRRDLGLQVLTPASIEFDSLVPPVCGFDIDLDEIEIRPDHLVSLQRQVGPADELWSYLAERQLGVMRNEQLCDELPLLHHSVIDRIYDAADYRPAALRRRAHRVWISDSEEQRYTGLREHLLLGKRICQVLKPGEAKEVTIYANQKYSRSGLMLEKGGEYYFEIPGNQCWNDGGIDCGPSGWERTTAALGMQEIFARIKQDERRYPSAKWFEVIGAVGKSDENLLQILRYQDTSHPFKALRGGELYAFPNDLDRQYFNNMGFIKLTIHRVK